MATMDSMQYSNYDNYSHRDNLDYDNPSYDSPTRSNFTRDEPGSPHGSYHSQQPYTHPEHRNPPPFSAGSDNYAPSDEPYNPPGPIDDYDYGYKDDYSQRDPSGVTSGYDSDTLNRDPYGTEPLPQGETGPPQVGGYGEPSYPRGDQGYPADDQGFHGDDLGYHGDDPGYQRNDPAYAGDAPGYRGDGYPAADPYTGNYDTPDGGELRRSPLEGDIIPQGAPLLEAGFTDPMGGDLDLADVIESLSSHNETSVINAAKYLTHLTYGDDDIKSKTRGLNGIPVLVELLNNPAEEIHSPASKALRNISFGKRNEENKIAIKNANGVATLVRLLKHTNNEDIREIVTGILWNMSSVEPIKLLILDEAVDTLMRDILIPETGWDPAVDSNAILRNEQPWTKVFTNCLGVLRNVSSAGGENDASVRRRLRAYPGMIEILINILSGAVGSSKAETSEMDSKCVEHAICIIRNISFRATQEINHPDTASAKTATVGKKGTPKAEPPPGKADVFSCFSAPKNKSQSNNKNGNNQSSSLGRNTTELTTFEDSHKPTGVEYLWNLGSIRVYVTLLSEGSNPVTLEAAAGTIQNITTGDSRMATNVRSCVRKEKGLPIMVELLRIDNDKVVLSLSRALRNLAVDSRNKELIGQYAMKDLVIRLPGGGSDNAIKPLSMESLTAILHLLHEVIKDNQEHAKALRNANGIDVVIAISKKGHIYPKPVVKASIMVLHTLWAFRDLRGFYRTDGYEEKDFVTGTWTVKRNTGQGAPKTNSNSSHQPQPLEPSSTLMRSSQPDNFSAPPPVSTYPSGTVDSRRSDYGRGVEDRTNGGDYPQKSMDLLDQGDYGSDQVPMQNLSYQGSDIGSLSRSRPPVGGVPVYGRTPEPQVESRLAADQRTQSPSQDSSYAPSVTRHHDDGNGYPRGYTPPLDEVSRQGSFQPADYAPQPEYHGNNGTVTRGDDYGYRDDHSHLDYSTRISPDPGLQEPASDSWV